MTQKRGSTKYKLMPYGLVRCSIFRRDLEIYDQRHFVDNIFFFLRICWIVVEALNFNRIIYTTNTFYFCIDFFPITLLLSCEQRQRTTWGTYNLNCLWKWLKQKLLNCLHKKKMSPLQALIGIYDILLTLDCALHHKFILTHQFYYPPHLRLHIFV